MRITELHRRLNEHFGADWAPSYCKDIVLSELGGQTIDEALALGVEAGEIWKAVLRHNPEIKSELR